MDMGDGRGDIILNASISYYESSIGNQGVAQNHFIEFLSANLVNFFFFSID